MSNRIRFGFSSGGGGSQYLQQPQPKHCALCLDDDRNANVSGVCQHNASVESALDYLRNYSAAVGQASSASSSLYGGGVSSLFHNGGPLSHDAASTTTTATTAAAAAALSSLLQQQGGGSFGGGGSSPPVSPNYLTLDEFLMYVNRMPKDQQLQNGGYRHHHNHYHHNNNNNNNSSSNHHQGRATPASRPPKSEMGCLRECAFCKSNGETAEFYKSHFLKDPVGRVRCPILQRYQCPFCYATGENAHTRRYCPKNPNKMCFIKSEQLVKQNLQ